MPGCKIKSTDMTRWMIEARTVEQPKGIDYEWLAKSMMDTRHDDRPLDLRSRGLRKRVVGDRGEDDNDALDFSDVIPIPGLIIPYENDDSYTAPIVSDWIAPHGPFWQHYVNI